VEKSIRPIPKKWGTGLGLMVLLCCRLGGGHIGFIGVGSFGNYLGRGYAGYGEVQLVLHRFKKLLGYVGVFVIIYTALFIYVGYFQVKASSLARISRILSCNSSNNLYPVVYLVLGVHRPAQSL